MRTVWLDDREHNKTKKIKNKKCKGCENALPHVGGWVGMKLLSIQAVLTSIPKKEIQCVEKRDNFSNGSKLTIKMYIWI